MSAHSRPDQRISWHARLVQLRLARGRSAAYVRYKDCCLRDKCAVLVFVCYALLELVRVSQLASVCHLGEFKKVSCKRDVVV